ncbi:hypothetical protein AYO22_04266 [Fonsecaea multimorphosa]|nr:hypothetical protein AYO22_04266 [Fonsecaea multimorphosa]
MAHVIVYRLAPLLTQKVPPPPNTDDIALRKASHLIRGDFSYDSAGEARHLLAGATSFFRSLKHQYEGDYEEGLQNVGDFQDEYGAENKSVFMFSGCKDEQTSADAFINGRHVGTYYTGLPSVSLPRSLSPLPNINVPLLSSEHLPFLWYATALKRKRPS